MKHLAIEERSWAFVTFLFQPLVTGLVSITILPVLKSFVLENRTQNWGGIILYVWELSPFSFLGFFISFLHYNCLIAAGSMKLTEKGATYKFKVRHILEFLFSFFSRRLKELKCLLLVRPTSCRVDANVFKSQISCIILICDYGLCYMT